MVKRSKLIEYKAQRYTKPIVAIKLKDKDTVVSVDINNSNMVFISTNNGYGLKYNVEEIPVTGLKSGGVKAISLKNDFVFSLNVFLYIKEYDVQNKEVIMGLNFRKSISLLPGVKLNLNKKSAGLSFGVKGARYSINTSGQRRATVGIPGTGISYTKTFGDKKKSAKTDRAKKKELEKLQKEYLELENQINQKNKIDKEGDDANGDC